MQTITYEKTPPVPAPEHEYAKLFPMLEGDAFERLKADIKENGVLEPIVFLDGHILDGRNRYYAARSLLIEYPRVDYDGDDPLAFVWSKNGPRRHLTESQLGVIAAKMETLKQGRPGKDARVHVSREQAAATVGISERTVAKASTVVRKGAPDLLAAVEAGKVSVSAAAEVATLPVDEQEEIVAHGRDAILDAARRIKEDERKAKLARQRENDAAREKARAALPEGVKRAEKAKAVNGSVHAAVASEPTALDTITAERDELREENAALKADIAERDKRLALFDDIAVRWEKGGFDAVKATLDDRIRALQRQVEDKSSECASLVRSRDFWKKQAIALGYVSPNSRVEEPEVPAPGPFDEMAAPF